MRHPSSVSDQANGLFPPVFGMVAAAELLDDAAWLSALCRVEAALARACSSAGLISADEAARVEAACDPATITLPAAEIEAGGNPVIPLVALLRQRAGYGAHFGATSQDVLDTASMLLARSVLTLICAELAASITACAELASRHRDTAMMARTLMQQALPTTFGFVAASWGAGLVTARIRLQAVTAGLAVQLGGPVGTLAGWHPHGNTVRAALAAELGLADPGRSWHTDRTPIAELAGALGLAAVAISKPALDVVLLSQSEVAELAEAAPGGSSAMPHKHNPIAASTARAAAAQAPGLVSTLLWAGAQELQRGAGSWHAEWPALRGLLLSVAGAANRLRTSLTGLRVDVAAMQAHLGGAQPAVGHAAEQVEDFVRAAARGGGESNG
jgi:3-carboxy-cis,cis-muconate cycloisomerase